MRFLATALILTAFATGQQSKPAAMPKPDESDPKNPVWDLRAKKDENKRYFQIGPAKDDKEPKDGYRLLIVLPGGDGGPGFMPFLRNLRKHVLGEDYILAELVAFKWKPDQGTVWPSRLVPAPKMEFTTDEFVADVVAELGKRHRLDKRHVFALGWSSSGHVIYDLSLAEKPLITGAYVAMAVFHPKEILPLKAAKGRVWYLDHSTDDEKCPYKDAETARDALKAAGGTVELSTYKGPHGWSDDPFGQIKKGIKFLEDQASGKK